MEEVRPHPSRQFFLVIHGETDAHAGKQLCGGGWDIPLNSEGLKQAKKLSKSLSRDKMGIKVIFSSPLLRCIQTTDVLHDVLKVKVRVVSGLAERHLGQWEKSEIVQAAGYSLLVEQIPGGENLNRFRARVKESIDYITDTAAPSGGVALVVSHEIFAQTLLTLLGVADQPLDSCVFYRFWRETPTTPWQIEAL